MACIDLFLNSLKWHTSKFHKMSSLFRSLSCRTECSFSHPFTLYCFKHQYSIIENCGQPYLLNVTSVCSWIYIYITSLIIILQLNYFVPCMIMLIIFAAFKRDAYIGEMNGACLVTLLCLYGFVLYSWNFSVFLFMNTGALLKSLCSYFLRIFEYT